MVQGVSFGSCISITLYFRSDGKMKKGPFMCILHSFEAELNICVGLMCSMGDCLYCLEKRHY